MELNNINNFTLGNNTLPLTTDLTLWGRILNHKLNKLTIKKINSKFIYEIYRYTREISYNLIKIKDSTNSTIIEFRDFLGKAVDTFNRVIGSSKYYIEEGKITLKEVTKKYQYIQPTNKHSKPFNKFITLDIETRTIDGVFIPYCICLYDGQKPTSFYSTDYSSYEDMLKSAIKSIMRNKYNLHVVYAHNLSGFDGIFLLKLLAELGTIEPLMRDGKIININFRFQINKDKIGLIKFRDSMLLLPDSLRNLAKSFGVEEKSHFPFKFVNDPNIDLNYIGKTPAFELFDYLFPLSYDKMIVDNWNLREEAIKYCIQDCISLYQIIMKFHELVYDKWSLNISKYSTISSLAFAIYRSNYLEANTIPKITGQMEVDIRKAFTGGRTDAFKPYSENDWI